MTEIKLPFGRNSSGRIVSVDSVVSGIACGCFCPTCSTPLIAAKGQIYRHHFRHQSETCSEAGETALHLFAKQTICERLELAPIGLLSRAESEASLFDGGAITDVLVQTASGEPVAIEIWVAHQVPQTKIELYNDHNHAALEIDLRNVHLADKSEAEWRDAVLIEAPRNWLSPMKEERQQREQERLRWLQAQKEKIEREKSEAARLFALKQERQRELEFWEKQAQKAVEEQQAREALAAAEREAKRQFEREENERRRLQEAQERHEKYEKLKAIEDRLRREMRGPDLQQLVAAHRGYNRITPEAWEQFDREVEEWIRRTRMGEFHLLPYSQLKSRVQA